MPKKSKKTHDNSQESTLGPFAKALGDVDGEKTTEREPEEPESGGDGEPVPEGEAEKREAPPEGETPQEG